MGALGVAILVGLATVGLLLLAGRAQATPTLDADIVGAGVSVSGTTTVDPATMSCSQAATTLEGYATSATTVALPIAPIGFAQLDATDLTLATAPTGSSTGSCTTLTLQGSASLFGSSAELLVVGDWSTTTPTFSVVLERQGVELSSLVDASTPGPDLALSQALLAVTSSSSGTTLDPSSLPSSSEAFLGSDLTIAGSGVTFRGQLAATGAVAAGLGTLGIAPGSVTLQGSLSASASFSTASVTAGLDLSASVTPDITTPSWLGLPGPFTFTVKGGGGTWTAGVTGAATVQLPQSGPATVDADFSITATSAGTTVAMDASLGTVTHPFGQSWLTLDQASVSWSVGVATTASLRATATLDATTFTASATVGRTTGLSLQLTTTATLDAGALASDLGLSLPSGTPTLSLSGLDVAVEVPGSGSVTVAATGTASLTIGSTSYNADVLVRAQLGSSGSLLVAARPTSQLTLSQLLGKAVTPDFTLPTVAVVVSTSKLDLPSDQLDGPTLSYFQPILCSSSDPHCSFTLEVAQGVGISASTNLPSSLQTMVCDLVSSATGCSTVLSGPVVIDGQVPLFGGTTTSLTVALPAIDVASGPLRQVSLHISLSESNGAFSLAAGGDLELFAPGSATGSSCPKSLAPSLPSGDVCLDLSVSGSITVSTSGASVKLTGQLATGSGVTGWTLPSPASWLTINDLAVQISVSTANGGSLGLGAHGALQIGSSDLGLSVDLAVTSEPPFVNLLGFEAASHSGMSLQDLVDLYNEISGQDASTSSLPPVAVQNLYFSYSSVATTSLCLSPGLYLSGDLVLTNSGPTSISGSPPSSQVSDCSPPQRSSACSSASSSCLASVFLSVNSSGIEGEGYVTGWSAGPLSFDPTNLDFTLDSSEVQIDISGGAALLDPTQYATEGANASVWGSGNLTLDVGTQKLYLNGSMDVGGLSGTVDATGTLDLSNPGFDLTDWFDTVQHAFQTAGTKITGAMDTVSTTATGWYSTYVATGANQVAGDVQSAFTELGNEPSSWQAVFAKYQAVSSQIDKVNSGLDKAGLSWLDIPTTTVFQDALDGLSFAGWRPCGIFGCVTIVPGFTVPGLCSYDPTVHDTPICEQPFSDIVASTRAQFADPSVRSHLASVGLSDPPGATPGSLVRTVHTLDPPGPSSITCAMTTADYAPGAAVPESPTTIQVSSLGHDVTFSGPAPTSLASTLDGPGHDLSQSTLDGLASGTSTGTCTSPPAPSPSVSVSLDRTWVYEGGTVTATGYLDNSSATSVEITWGDGTTSNATVTDGAYSASHTYTDESAGGAHSPFTVTVTATGVASDAAAQVSVLDAPLSLSSLSVSPEKVDLMTPVTVTGTLAAPEPGETETATVTWGDATAPTVVPVGSDGSFSATHAYEVLSPSGAPSRSEPISVTVAEPDATSTAGSATVTVDDVAPTGTTLTPTAGATVSGGTVFTHSGTDVTWSSGALDITPEATLLFRTAWDDGTAPTELTASTPSGPVAQPTGWYPYTAASSGFAHTFPAACLDLVTTTVTDADTLSAPTLTTPVVVTAPLGATAMGSNYWLGQLRVALWVAAHPGSPADVGRGDHLQLSTAQLTCYLRIAQYLSPALGRALGTASSLQAAPSLQAAADLLEPGRSRFDPQGRAGARLDQQLLTTLLDFANGTGNWSRYSAAVAAADSALSAGSERAMTEAITTLDQVTFGDPGLH